MILVSPPALEAPAPPQSARTEALLKQVRSLPPEGRRKVVAQMERAVAQASPSARPALEELLRIVKSVAAEPPPEKPAQEPIPANSLERYRKLSPKKQKKVLAQLESEAAKASPADRPGLELLIRRLKAGNAVSNTKERIRASIDNFRDLDPEGRAKVLAQLERDAAAAPPDLKRTLEALIGRLKAI